MSSRFKAFENKKNLSCAQKNIKTGELLQKAHNSVRQMNIVNDLNNTTTGEYYKNTQTELSMNTTGYE